MRGPSRSAGRTAWVGRPTGRTGAADRECPHCPARPYQRCLHWNPENFGGGESGEGRWDPHAGKGHQERRSPGGVQAKAIMSAAREQCAKTGRHGYHWYDHADVRTWCRGVL